MNPIKIEFKDKPKLYAGRHFEIRLMGSQIRFYEVQSKPKREYCLSRDTVQALLRYGALPRLKVIKQALSRDKTIFE